MEWGALAQWGVAGLLGGVLLLLAPAMARRLAPSFGEDAREVVEWRSKVLDGSYSATRAWRALDMNEQGSFSATTRDTLREIERNIAASTEALRDIASSVRENTAAARSHTSAIDALERKIGSIALVDVESIRRMGRGGLE